MNKGKKTVQRKAVEKIAIGLLIVCAVAFWGKEIKSGFFADDFNTFLPYFNKMKNAGPGTVIPDLISGRITAFYRPLSDLMYYVNFLISGNNPAGYMVFGILSHLLTSALVFWLVCIVFRNKFAGLISASLFCFFFRHFEAVKWISQPKIITPLFLFSLIMYLYFKRTDKIFFYLFSLLSFFLALFSQESAFILPFIVLLSFIYSECKFDVTQLSFKRITPALFFIGLYFIIDILYVIILYGFHHRGLGNPVNPIVQDFFNVCYFFIGLVFPFSVGRLKWSLHHYLDTGEFTPLLRTIFQDNWHLVLIGLIVGFCILFAVYHRRRYPDVLYGIIWICLTISPFVFFVGNANRYFTIPSVGFCMIVAALLVRIKKSCTKYILILLILAFHISVLSFELRYWNYKSAQQYELSKILRRNYPFLGEFDVVLWEDKDLTSFLKKYPILRQKRTLEYMQGERSKFIEFPESLEISGYIGEYFRWLYGYPAIQVYRADLNMTAEEFKNLVRETRSKYMFLSYDGRTVVQKFLE